MARDYEKIYEKILDYEEHLHKKNQKKIKVGIKVNIFLPLVFLLLCFAFPDTDLIFLILWIVSLFGIATYLIYVEYNDYKLRSKLMEFGVVDQVSEVNLMGDNVDLIEQAIDERIAMEKQRFAQEMETLNKERESIRQERKEQIKQAKDRIIKSKD